MRIYNRKCIVTGQILPVNELIKFVLLKDGTIILDKDKKIKGRGAYCKNDFQTVSILFEKRLLNRSFKKNISINTYEQLRKEIEDEKR